MSRPLSNHIDKQSDRVKDEALELLRDLTIEIETGRIVVTDSDLSVYDGLQSGTYRLQFKYEVPF